MDSPIQHIKEKLDIVEFIRSYITLLPAGKNFKANCPFHKEKTPSFIVSPDRQSWHCFGACAEGGDIFKFLMKYENIEFYEALRILAEKASVELKHLSPADQRQFGVLYDINEAAKNFFKKELERVPAALKYLKERGLKREIIEEFELGFAEDHFEKLTLYLLNAGFAIADIERSGLAVKSERGGYFDRFRNRIMFPIYNSFGKTIGFSGRIFNQPMVNGQIPAKDAAKYINSPETQIFNKSRVFYGLHKAKSHIKEKGEVFLVEGQMDFLMVYQEGVKNVLATSGTALTHEHLKTLRRLTDKLVFSFDADEAGLKAAERGIDLANNEDFNVKLIIFSDCKDPAEAVQKNPGIMAGLIQNAKPAMIFYFERYLGSLTNGSLTNGSLTNGSLTNAGNAERRGDFGDFKKNLRIVLGKIKNIASPVERAHWIKELSLLTNLNESSLSEEMEALKSPIYKSLSPAALQSVGNSMAKFSRREIIAQRLLSLVMAKDFLRERISSHLEYFPEDYARIFDSLGSERGKISDALNQMLDTISLRSSMELDMLGEEKLEEEFFSLLREIELEFLRERRSKMIAEIKKLEKSSSEAELQLRLKEFDELSKRLENIK